MAMSISSLRAKHVKYTPHCPYADGVVGWLESLTQEEFKLLLE